MKKIKTPKQADMRDLNPDSVGSWHELSFNDELPGQRQSAKRLSDLTAADE